MKKKLIIILAALVLAAPFVPVPSASYDDGGTREYKALTYKLVKWNRLYSGDLCYNSPRIYFYPNNKKSIDELWKEIAPDDTAEYEQENAQETEIQTHPDLLPKGADGEVLTENVCTSAAVMPGDSTKTQGDTTTGICSGVPLATDVVTGVTQNTTVGNSNSTTSFSPGYPDYNPESKFHSIRVSRTANGTQSSPDSRVEYIRSHAELEKYINKYGKYYDLTSHTKDGYADRTIGFANAVSKYNDAYFKNNALILFNSAEPSGSIYYTGVYVGAEGVISVERFMPEVRTDDMAAWIGIIERPKTDPIFKINSADVQLIFSE